MTTAKLSRAQVLELFAMEPDTDGQALQRYLQAYPEYAPQLIDLSREIFRFEIQDESPLSAEDQMRIDSAWSRIQSAPMRTTTDPFSSLSVTKLREIAQALGVPRQVLTAFRERAVLLSSVPQSFLARLAGAMNMSVQHLIETLALPPQSLARSYKADGKPSEAAQITFEQLLRDAGVSEEQVKSLLAGSAENGRG